VLAGLYYGAAELGYVLAFTGQVASIVWLPVGVGIAFLYLGGLRYWPGVLIGDLLTNIHSDLPTVPSLVQTCGNVFEVVVATWLILWLVRRGSPLDTVGGVACMLLAITAGTVLSATVGTLVLLPYGVLTAGDLPGVWRTWWLGDFSGAIVIVPLALAWCRRPFPDVPARRWAEAVAAIAATVALTAVIFDVDEPLVFVIFPALIWIALRFGRREATLTVTLVVAIAIRQTTHSLGPFAYDSITQSLLVTQLFIALASLLTLFVTAVVTERELFADRLAASRLRLVEASDAERTRIERNLHDGSQQRLSALVSRVREARERPAPRAGGTVELLQEIESQLRLGIEELRELAHGLHPAPLRDFGLAEALRGLASHATVPIDFVELPSRRADASAEATAYYVVVEAITNAQRHAQASSVSVRAALDDGSLDVEVADDGIGGAIASLGSGLGGLADRVEALGGTFDVDSAPGRGTRISAAIPSAPARAG
jgi:signal transduction histidine kinase